MTLLAVYNKKSGKGKIANQIDYIVETLSQKYEIETYTPKEDELIRDHIKNLTKVYDVILAIGGDGTINAVVSGVVELPYTPKIAIIPRGTVNDMARNFGMSMRLKKNLKILLESDDTREHDVYKVNDGYFDYAFAIGVATGASYIDKKPLGPLSYYFAAVKMFLKDKDLHLKIKINDEIIEGKYNSVIVTNTRYIAGFKVKKREKLTVVLIKGNRFMYALRFFWFVMTSRAKYQYLTDSLEIEADSAKYNADGEGVPYTNTISISKYKTLEFICKKKKKKALK